MKEFIKRFIKRIRCKHDYKFYRNGIVTRTEDDFSGDGCYNTWQEHYTEYICTKCGKTKRVFK